MVPTSTACKKRIWLKSLHAMSTIKVFVTQYGLLDGQITVGRPASQTSTTITFSHIECFRPELFYPYVWSLCQLFIFFFFFFFLHLYCSAQLSMSNMEKPYRNKIITIITIIIMIKRKKAIYVRTNLELGHRLFFLTRTSELRTRCIFKQTETRTDLHDIMSDRTQFQSEI